jgi:signal transduction histidine kinase/CheY-like chemotaxis protein/PAS domain-containing protein
LKNYNEAVLLELSLTIKPSLDAGVILDQFLPSVVRLLGQEAAVVVDCAFRGSRQPVIAGQYPPFFDDNQDLQEFFSDESLSGLCTSQDVVNRELASEDRGLSQQSFRLPGFGVLLLVGAYQNWNDEFSQGWQRLMHNLADALKSCAIHQGTLLENRRLGLAASAASVGIWEYEVRTGRLTYDKQTAAIFGQNGGGVGAFDFFFNWIIPEDLLSIKDHFANLSECGEGEYTEFTFRIVLRDGIRKKLFSKASTSCDVIGEKTLIGALHDVTDLELAASESLYRSKLEDIMNSLSMKIISAGWEDFDEITDSALREVGEYVGADRAYRMLYDFDASLCDNTHEWCAAGVSPEMDNLQRVPIVHIPLFVSAHRKGLPFHLQRVSDLPEDHHLRKMLEPQGIQSLIAIPLMDRGNCLGFIGFDSVRSLRHWTEVDVTLLKFLADLLVNADLKFRREKAIERASHDLEEARMKAEALASQAKAANDAKTRFLATISHEIRTPLHAILGFSDMLFTDKNQDDFIDHVNSIRESGSVLQDLINDVLDLSKIESNEIVPQMLDFNFFALLQTCHRMFTPLAASRGIALDVNFGDASKEIFQGDQLRIREVLNNVIGNAIKFTNHGGVAVDVRRLGPDIEAPDGIVRHFEIQVVDSGIGISREFTSKIFEPFFQADDGNGRVYSGAGLGLSIARKSVELIGGSISVESFPEEGTTFTILLPLFKKSGIQNETSSLAGPDPTESHLASLKILFAEDNVVNQQLARIHLKDHRCELVVVTNGAEALQKFKESPFDIVLMDCQMPVMDGFESAQAMREHQGASPRTPIIAVTASALSGDKAQCFAAGMDDVLSKPYSKSEFLAKIYQWTNCTP